MMVVRALRWPLVAVLVVAWGYGCAVPNAALRAQEAPYCVDWMTQWHKVPEGGVACPRPDHRLEIPRQGVAVCRCEQGGGA